MTSNNQRPVLPAGCPDLIKLALYRHNFRGKTQWQGRYRFYVNGKPSDHVTVVVNTTYHICPEHDGQEWWVKPISWAPRARIVFASARHKAEAPPAPVPRRPVRFGDDLDFWDIFLAEFRL